MLLGLFHVTDIPPVVKPSCTDLWNKTFYKILPEIQLFSGLMAISLPMSFSHFVYGHKSFYCLRLDVYSSTQLQLVQAFWIFFPSNRFFFNFVVLINSRCHVFNRFYFLFDLLFSQFFITFSSQQAYLFVISYTRHQEKADHCLIYLGLICQQGDCSAFLE